MVSTIIEQSNGFGICALNKDGEKWAPRAGTYRRPVAGVGAECLLSARQFLATLLPKYIALSVHR